MEWTTRSARASRPALAGLCLALLAHAPARADDSSVADRLEQRGISYEVDDDGDYKVVYEYKKEGRTQLVFVSGGTETVRDLTVREVFAPAARVEAHGIDGDRALELLRDSGMNKLGAWEIRGDALYFVIKVFDGVSAIELEQAMDIVAEVADDKEIELTGGSDDL